MLHRKHCSAHSSQYKHTHHTSKLKHWSVQEVGLLSANVNTGQCRKLGCSAQKKALASAGSCAGQHKFKHWSVTRAAQRECKHWSVQEVGLLSPKKGTGQCRKLCWSAQIQTLVSDACCSARNTGQCRKLGCSAQKRHWSVQEVVLVSAHIPGQHQSALISAKLARLAHWSVCKSGEP